MLGYSPLSASFPLLLARALLRCLEVARPKLGVIQVTTPIRNELS